MDIGPSESQSSHYFMYLESYPNQNSPTISTDEPILKDTAFLMIITVPELTFVASSVQATYFVPFASFIVAMILYWIVTLIIEATVRRVEAAADMRRA